ncbi:hypothetical protein ACOZ4L_11000 [Haloplanus ruber]|uniref:Uncharacterized protein n=1 Tax=Haloplanus ruber TaxID=869892 RepID=A0ABD6CTP2_9EURY|nr:hypothetical protein [Haloplanus ruber]
MHATTHRRLCGALGAGLLALIGGILVLAGAAPFGTPALAVQVVLVVTAGAFDVVAAFENPATARIDWVRLSGAAKVALGLALPVGVGGQAGGVGGPLVLVAAAAGGLSLVAVGVDMWYYAGRHVYGRPLSVDTERGANER